MKWIRTCQECGTKQECPRPTYTNKTIDGFTDAYCNRACKKCKSEALDHGTKVPETPKEIEDAKKFIEEWEGK